MFCDILIIGDKNMKETEITVEVLDSFLSTKNTLEQQGFSCIETFTMTDKYYSLLKQEKIKNLSFQNIIKNSFLIRHITSNNCSTYNALIYKNKIFNDLGQVIEEEKVQTTVENTEKVCDILRLAGFHSYITIQSTNLVYKKDNVEFVVQDVNNLGLFIELEELEHMETLKPEEKINQLINILKQLKLPLGDNFHCNKLEMLLKKDNQ